MSKAKTGVKGKRSPRWAVWGKMMIPCKSGIDYLFRLRLVQTPWFGVYLHDIFEEDSDNDPHNHPWSFISVVLRGSYIERLYPDPVNRRDHYVLQEHRRWSVHRMGRNTAHRIVKATPGLKTLIFTGPRRDTWGFVCQDPANYGKGRFVEWTDYEINSAPAS